MNFQEKVLEASAELRARAGAIANATLQSIRGRDAAQRIARLKKSLTVLNSAGREFKKVARQHANRFVKQNSPLIAAVRKDVSELARSTYRSLATNTVTRKTRRPKQSNKRVRKAA